MRKIGKKKFLISFSFFLIISFGLYFAQNILKESEDEFFEEELLVEILDEIGNEEAEELEEISLEEDAQKVEINYEEKQDQEEEIIKKEKEASIAESSPVTTSLQKLKPEKNKIKIGFATDFHVRSISYPASGGILEKIYVNRINYFIDRMNKVYLPDIIVLGGDIIEGTKIDSEIGKKELLAVKNLFNRATTEKYWVVGNHDLRSVSKNQWKNALGINYLTKSFEVGDYRIIILDSNFTRNDENVSPGNQYTRGKVSEKQIKWLEKELVKSKKRTLVFLHHPPLRGLESKTDFNLLYNARVLQEIFSKHGVLAVISGHIEDLYFQKINGVNYIVFPGMIKHPKYQGAFGEISIKKEEIIIYLNYKKGSGEYQRIKIEME